ncbi:hypothetical protein HBH25_13455 [Pseudomonas sp. hsmgli-8]|uniref:Uncharacterized protein n=2 Tax=Pseudomonas TaxID=286 RepID=A0ABX0YI63_9PSED|nr:hypothetical protein [Pseudomonas sp. LY10J]NJP01856.1 hypothetical protein [Pseudomonas quercus]
MRGYMELIDFMRDLGDGILDHLPEEQRLEILTTEEILERWMKKKSYLQALSLKKDIISYAQLYESGNYSVDEIFADFDLCFIPERFGVEEHIFLTGILGLIETHIKKKKKSFLLKYIGWLGYK